MARCVKDPACLCGSAGLISSPAQWVKDLVLLQLWHSHSSGLDSIPGPGTSICTGAARKKRKKKKRKKERKGIPTVAQQKQIQLVCKRIWVLALASLAQWVWDPALPRAVGVGHRHGLDPESLWLWYRPVAVALIRALSWELLYAWDAAIKKGKKEFPSWHSG